MSLGLILVIVFLVALFGGAVPWQRGPAPNPNGPYPNYWHGYGLGPVVPGGLGLIVLVLVVLLLFGRI